MNCHATSHVLSECFQRQLLLNAETVHVGHTVLITFTTVQIGRKLPLPICVFSLESMGVRSMDFRHPNPHATRTANVMTNILKLCLIEREFETTATGGGGDVGRVKIAISEDGQSIVVESWGTQQPGMY